jgi:hypothetical protein
MDRRDREMGRSTDPMGRSTEEKPGRLAMFVLAALVGVAFVGALVVGLAEKDNISTDDRLAFADQPTSTQISECNRYASMVAEEGTTAGEPPPQISDDDQGLVGLNDENRQSNAARAAYRDCMLGIQRGS